MALRSSLPLAAALLAALVATSVAAGVPRTETKAYVGGAGEAAVVCGQAVGLDGTGLDGACFDLDGTESHIAFTVTDDAGWTVGGQYRARVPPGIVYASGFFCGEASFDVPKVAGGRLFVLVSAAGLGCPAGEAGPGTAGLITVEFS